MFELRALALIAALSGLGACGPRLETARMPLIYAAQTAVTPAPQARAVVTVGDVRVSRDAGSEDAAWVGTIRGTFGQPIKKLYADAPVDQVVARALREGLRARSLLAPDGAVQRRLVVDVARFDAGQYARSEGAVTLRLTLLDGMSGQQLWADSVQAYRVEGSAFRVTVGGPIEDLHALLARVLGEAVDQALDNPGFRAALGA